MKILKMTINDYDEIYNLWMSCKGMGLNNLDDSRDGIERFIKRNPDTCFIYKEDNKIVGAIFAGNDGRRGYIYHTAVSEEYRSRGIGKALVEKVLKTLGELGINKVGLLVFNKNENGNVFWEKLGFTTRDDLVYRNKTINEAVRIDT